MASPRTRSPKKLRVGLIGAGGIAGAHVRGYLKTNQVQIVAAADVVPANLDRADADWGCTGLYDDWKAMLEKEDLDAVSVCTPNALHMQPTIDALAAGCHVLVEKPLAVNAAEGEKMIAAARKANRELIVGFQYRFNPHAQFLRRAVAAGQMGDMKHARVHALRRRGVPNWGVFGQKDRQGGGGMIDIGVHMIESAHYVMGSPTPVSASGQTFTYLGNRKSSTLSRWADWDYRTYTVEDYAVGQIRFDTGAIMSVEAGFIVHQAEGGIMDFKIFGTKGGGHYATPEVYTDQFDTMVTIRPDWLPPSSFNDMFNIKMQAFVDTALHGKPNEAPAEHGLMIQKMIDAIYASAEQGREVAII
jgi:predicted dehydrogenase